MWKLVALVERIEKSVVFGIMGNYSFGKCEGLKKYLYYFVKFEWTKEWKLKGSFFYKKDVGDYLL